MPNILVQLGQVVFSNLEVPEKIPFGGDQSLAIQKLVGGQRVIDALGRDDMAMTWDGVFLGANALQRAQNLNYYRIAGQPLPLTWDQLNFTVVIHTFEADYAYAYHIPYRITCEVVQDNASPVLVNPGADVDTQMASDLATANTYTGLINDSLLTSLMATVSSTINAVSTFVNLLPGNVAPVLGAIGAAQGRVQVLFTKAITTTEGINAVGGVLPGVPNAQNVGALSTQVGAFQSQNNLLMLGSTLGRLNANAQSGSNNTTTVTLAGGDLQPLAAQVYGDATSWTAIAKANGLSDPEISGLQSIVVPHSPDTVGGVLGV